MDNQDEFNTENNEQKAEPEKKASGQQTNQSSSGRNTAEERFMRDAEKQVNRLMKDFTALSELSIKHKNAYTEEHIEQVFKALRRKLENTRKSFRMQDEDEDSFSFGDDKK